MATTIETVSIKDVHPLYDEYGNCMARRDYSLPENVAYVEELARSMAKKGVPDEMVTLVRDGDVLRIKAGNSRIEAMKILGTTEFEAIVEDDDEAIDRAIVETTIRTNTKKKYEAIEESRFVQQLMLMSDDVGVAEVTGMEAEKVAGVRRACESVGEAAETMSLLKLLAIDEFSGDEEAKKRLSDADESSWERVANELREKRERRARWDEIIMACDEADIDIVSDREDVAGMSIKCYVRVVQDLNGAPDGSKVRDEGEMSYYRFVLYVPAKGKDKDEIEAENEMKEYLCELEDAAAKVETRMCEWLADKIEAGVHPAFVVADIEGGKRGLDYYVNYFLNTIMATRAIRIPVTTLEVIERFVGMMKRGMCCVNEWGDADEATIFKELLSAMEAEGYESGDLEKKILKRADELIDEAKDEDDE